MSAAQSSGSSPPLNEHEARKNCHALARKQLHERLEHAARGGGEAAHRRQAERGKLSVRQRLAYLLDKGAPFLELSALAGFERQGAAAPGAGLVTGIGRVAGSLCMVVANDPSVKGGSYFPETVKKHLRAQQIAQQNRLPCIYLVDSGGIFLPEQARCFADAEHFGRIFANQAQMSAQGIAQLAVVLGLCTAGGAYVPAMADENIVVRGQSTIYLAGPPLVEAATGEQVDAETLGGAEMHCRTSGVADHLADSEVEALDLCRRLVHGLPHRPQRQRGPATASPRQPKISAQDMLAHIPRTLRQPMAVRPLLDGLLDEDSLDEFKALYGTTLVCGFARLEGQAVGVVANDGILFGASAQKGAHFINLCEQRGVPLLFVQNIAGFMVGRVAEQAGIAKDGAKMVQAVACATVPKITLMVGASHGAGNYAMCGRGFGARFIFTWPRAKISVMGPEQAADVLVAVKRGQGTALDADEIEAIRAPVLRDYAQQADAYYATSQLWDDGIIDPLTTRRTLALAFAACADAQACPGRAPVFRM